MHGAYKIALFQRYTNDFEGKLFHGIYRLQCTRKVIGATCSSMRNGFFRLDSLCVKLAGSCRPYSMIRLVLRHVTTHDKPAPNSFWIKISLRIEAISTSSGFHIFEILQFIL
jgi:hypothetical protein